MHTYKIDETHAIWRSENTVITRCRNSVTRQIRCARIINNKMVKKKEDFLNELTRFKELDHPNIIRLYEWYEDDLNYILITDLCSGETLIDRISSRSTLNERTAANLFRQMACAIAHCASKGIYYDDLTPSKFLFSSKDSNAYLMLVDLGISSIGYPFSKGTWKFKGDPRFVSPEQILGQTHHLSNMWSLGVILYIMLCGSPPFTGSSERRIIEQVEKRKISFDISIWDDISKECKNLIVNLLTLKEKRLTPEQVLKHPWLLQMADSIEKIELPKIVTSNLKAFKSSEKLKKAILTYLAMQQSEREIAPLRQLFRSLDINGDGQLSMSEVRVALKGRPDEAELLDLLFAVDVDNSGTIDYTEFMTAVQNLDDLATEGKLKEAFNIFDKDGSGKISIEELKYVLNREVMILDKEVWQPLIDSADKNGDGEIDFSEFCSLLQTPKNI